METLVIVISEVAGSLAPTDRAAFDAAPQEAHVIQGERPTLTEVAREIDAVTKIPMPRRYIVFDVTGASDPIVHINRPGVVPLFWVVRDAPTVEFEQVQGKSNVATPAELRALLAPKSQKN